MLTEILNNVGNSYKADNNNNNNTQGRDKSLHTQNPHIFSYFYCILAGCPEMMFSCESGECIQQIFVCDDITDCFDSSDEDGCPMSSEGKTKQTFAQLQIHKKYKD